MKDKNGGMNEEGDLRIFKNHSCEEAWANSVPYLFSEVSTGEKMSPRYTTS